jgi:inorganic pyrophosphatase
MLIKVFDVFVLTTRQLLTGQLFECEVIGLVEQFEDGIADHNVKAAGRHHQSHNGNTVGFNGLRLERIPAR